MGNSVEKFNASTQDEGQQAITPYKKMTVLNRLGNASGGKPRGMHAKKLVSLVVVLLAGVASLLLSIDRGRAQDQSAAQLQAKKQKIRSFDDQIGANAQQMIDDGRQTFRFDTFGDEAFWGDMLKLHQAIEGASFGGTGPGLTPSAALGLGLKVDLDALPKQLEKDLEKGRVDLNSPATTLALLKLDAVL